MKRILNSDQRNVVAGRLMELANLILVALVIGQLLGDTFDLLSATAGLALFAFVYRLAFRYLRGGGD